MVVWLDAHLSPRLARWLDSDFGVSATPVNALGLRDAEDPVIFAAARKANAVVLTKDADFVQLLERLGPPPQVVWITCGNTSELHLRDLLRVAWPRVVTLLEAGEMLVEISDAAP
ncbi:MAG: DUF5615 family PIN-like protein [Gemmatimonadaceae bacterium]|nr:DUF5615 family PIN-like protein [Gemmatimonadaceae bacterium]